VTALDTRAPARAPGVELLGELTGSGYNDAPSLVRRGDGQTLQITTLLYQLLEALDGERGIDQLAEELGRCCGKQVAPEDVTYLLERKLAPLGLLVQADGSPPPLKKSTPLLGLKLKVVVSDPDATRRITRPFAWLFRLWVVVPVLVAFVITCWWVLWERGLAGGPARPSTRPASSSWCSPSPWPRPAGTSSATPQPAGPEAPLPGRWAPASTSSGLPSTPTSTTPTGSAGGAGSSSTSAGCTSTRWWPSP